MKRKIGKIAVDHFTSEYNCAQSVLMAILKNEEKMFKEAINIAAGFGAGMGYQCSNCGALSGGVMAAGILCGEKGLSVREHARLTYQMTSELFDKFEAEFGTRICDELIGIDMHNPEELQRARDENIFYTKCITFIEKVVEFVLELNEAI
ncbi:MAG: hypothetical protein GF411_19485 [Candidatus Lokiarchaeota archaeon]|nr:hypothetical protein [Candidatus Lokiarchaeota archaeon]